MPTTKTGSDITRLSEVDLSGANFSKRGVVDRSGLFEQQAKAFNTSGIADAVRVGGGIALDIDEGFAKGTLEGNINDFIARTRPGEVVREQQSLFNDANNDLRELQSRTTQPGDITDTLDRDAPEFKAIMKKYEIGAQQGVITRDELEIRAKDATRKAIARRPGLARELTQHAEQVLNLSGVRDIQDFEDEIDELEAKRFEAGRTRIINEAIKAGLVIDHLDPDITGLNNELQRIAEENAAYETSQHLLSLSDEEAAANRDVALRNAPLAISGMYNKFVGLSKNHLRDGMTQQELAGVILEIENLGRDFKGNARSTLAKNDIMGADAKPHTTHADALIDSYIQSLREFAGGGSIAEFAANSANTIKNNQEISVRNNFNVPLMNLQNNFMNTPFGNILARSNDVQNKLAVIGSQLAGAELTGGNFTDSAITTDIRAGIPDLVTATTAILQASTNLPAYTDEQKATRTPEHFEKAIQQVSELLIDNPHGLSSEARFNNLKHLTISMGDPGNAEFLNNTTPAAKAALGDLYDQYAIVLTNMREKAIEKAEASNVKVNVRFEEDGRMVFDVKAPDQRTQREFSNRLNNGVGNRSNELIKAFGNLFGENGKTTKRILTERNNDFVKDKIKKKE